MKPVSSGVTPTEKLLTAFCERSFLKLWAYANPYKDDGHEMCDLIAVFGNTVFLFFDRAKPWTAGEEVTPQLAWDRWKRDAIDRQVKTAYGAERYIRNRRKVFLDGARTKLLPLEIAPDCRVYKIIVANGVAEACKNASLENIGGSLGVAYASADSTGINVPFFIKLEKEHPVHVLDSHSMPIVLGELDTVEDFATYLQLKEEEIARKLVVSYCGEEDYLAHYLAGDSEEAQAAITVRPEGNTHAVVLPEGAWFEFSKSDLYRRTKRADEVSYGWDQLINGACEHFLEGKSHGNADLFDQLNPVYDMVKV